MAAFAEMCNINCMTSSDLAFANQAAAQEIVQAEKMAALLDNLANVSIQKNNIIDKLVATNQQQAKNHFRSHCGHCKVEEWQSTHGATIGMCESSPLEIHQASLPGTQQGTAGRMVIVLRWDTAALLVLFPEKDIARMLLALTRRAVATLDKAGPNLPLDRARQWTQTN
jgi:hypothetical protein